MLKALAARTSSAPGAVAVNLLEPHTDPNTVTVAASHARVVEFFWFDPDPALVALVHEGGALAGWQVGSLAEARAAVRAGCDLITVQGVEAGGHVRGEAPLLPLLYAVLDEVDVPVLAAGGIGDARSLADVLEAGAAGARMGTRFVATEEAGAHPRYKQALVDAEPGGTEISDAFAVCPLCTTRPRARFLSSAVAAVHAFDGDVVGEAVLDGEVLTLRRGFGMPPGPTCTGAIEAMAMYASDAVRAVKSVVPAAAVVEEVVGGAESLLRHGR
jgi:nitronate monooxygenase